MKEKTTLHPIDTAKSSIVSKNKAEEIIAKLTCFHKIAQYRILEVDTCLLKPLCKYVVKERLQRVHELHRIYKDCDAQLYDPLQLKYEDGTNQFVAPPIVECRKGDLILCDGMHRIYHAKSLGVPKVKVVVITGITIPLPGKVLNWSEVLETDFQPKLSDNFVEFSRSNLTGYSYLFNGLSILNLFSR